MQGHENDQAARQISTGQLNTLLCLHLQPINPVVFGVPLVPLARQGNLVLEEA